MTENEVRKLDAGHELLCGPFTGRVTCVDLTTDDKIVVKWDCSESEDVLCDSSPLWHHVEQRL